MSKYVVRGYNWGYNDEVFYPSGSYIKTVFDNEADARREMLRLERQHWSRMDLGETGEFFDGSSSFIKRVNDFVRLKTGQDLFRDFDDTRDTFIPSSLSDEDYAEFLDIAGLEAFKLTVFEDDPVFYALWCCPEEKYFTSFDECFESLVFEESLNELLSELEYRMACFLEEDHPEVLSGSLANLSHTPSVLNEFIQLTKGFSWNEKEERIELDGPAGADILALNDLLKTPFFRVDKLSLEETQKLIKELEDNFYE